ncbi:MAG: serine hydrolase [Gemmatimonadales bacterium]
MLLRVVLGGSFIVTGTAAPQAAPFAGFDRYVEQAMAAWKVPGLAAAVVANGKVVLSRGYGVREVGKPDRVDDHTIFAIGSATKAFTVAALGLLVDEGKLGLDDPVRRHLLGFELADPIANQAVTVRDLVTHRTGVGGGDLLWASGGFDRHEIVRRIRHVPATWGFRTRFDYSNIMFIAAGEVLAAAAGKSWDEVVGDRLFLPLGMTRSNTTVRALGAMANVATPHDPTDASPRSVPWRNMDNTVAGGGINSSVADMAKWLQLHLAGGAANGRQLLSAAFVKEMQLPQTIIPREGSWEAMAPEAHFLAYGLGWIISDRHGKAMLQHGGGIDGMSAMVGLMPELGVGIVVLSNLNGNQLPASLMRRVFDAYQGVPATDWSEWYLARVRQAEAEGAAATAAMNAKRVAGTSPTLELARYVGTYRHDAWGDAVVTLENGKLALRYGTEFVGELEHVQHDAFRANWRNPARGRDYLNFTIDVTRQAAALDLYLWVTAHFTKVGESR